MVRSVATLPDGRNFRGTSRRAVSVSPDGRQVVYTGIGGLYIRAMDALDARIIPGSEDLDVVTSPVFSPDGQSVVFYMDGQLRRIAVAGGSSVALTAATNPFGMSWVSDGTILYGQTNGIWTVSENGGEGTRLVATDSGIAHSPQRLPGSEWVLFSLVGDNAAFRTEESEIIVESPATGERRTVRVGGTDARYVPTGHLVYADSGVLYAVRFDVDRLEVTGGPVPVVEGVTQTAWGLAQFDVSATGTLAFIPGPSQGFSADFTLASADRTGTVTTVNVSPGPYVHVRASPEGTRLALDSNDGNEEVIWIYELDGTSAIRRLTFGGRNRFPVWSPDGQRIAFQSDRNGDQAIFLQDADGAGGVERLTTPDDGHAHVPESWSPDGKYLSFSVAADTTNALWILSLEDDTTTPFGNVQSIEPIGSVFSPDGQWIAYHSVPANETSLSTSSGVFVEPFPATGARYQAPKVLRDFQPVWVTGWLGAVLHRVDGGPATGGDTDFDAVGCHVRESGVRTVRPDGGQTRRCHAGLRRPARRPVRRTGRRLGGRRHCVSFPSGASAHHQLVRGTQAPRARRLGHAFATRHSPRPLLRHGQNRRRRHGGGVSSERYQARPGCGAQGVARGVHARP